MRRADEPLERRDIQLFKGDWEHLQEILGKKMSPTEFIRKLVRSTIIKVRLKQRKEDGKSPQGS